MNDIPEPRIDKYGRRIYEPDGAVLKTFLLDRSPVSIIRGPWGSGTSVACCQRIWQHLVEQNRSADGKRRSRWQVARETYPQIETTTLETWLYWFPEKIYGKLYTGTKPYRHEIRVGDIEADIYFRGLAEDNIQQLLSLEPTAWWFNELEPVTLNLFSRAFRRTGRYPPKIEGGSAWSGCIADMNAPPANHWVPIMMGEAPPPEDMRPEDLVQFERPEGWAYYPQPPAMFEVRQGNQIVGYEVNPNAENLRWLEDGYYEKQLAGTTKRDIDANILNKIVPLVEGDPIHIEFNYDLHRSTIPLEPVPGYPIRLGLDFGRNPACVYAQLIGERWRILRERYVRDMGASKFAPIVARDLQEHYPGYEVIAHGDPKGDDKVQTDEKTAYQVFATNKIIVRAAPVKQNNIQTRLDVVDMVLREVDHGVPRLMISSNCTMLINAMNGGYRWPKIKPGVNQDRKPIKDRYSDLADSVQYLLLGGGEGRALIGQSRDMVKTPAQAYKRRSRRRGSAAHG
ncbi:MAG: hypothetical protein OER56_16555 [Hyphomicrobiales bacterium]|nr:hypothetical protein [Hyphomicrobiales bacterium]